MRIIGNDPNKPRQTAATASGTLPNGRPVVVNSDGTVSVVAAQTPSANTPLPVTDTAGNSTTVVYDPDNQKVIMAWYDAGNSDYGTAVVGTVSGNSITFGSEVVFESADTDQLAMVYDPNANKVVIAYRDVGNSSYGTAIVGTVSGNSISFGTPTVFNSGTTTRLSQEGICFDSTNNKIVIVYMDLTNNQYATAVVGTVSGTGISFGSEVVFQNNTPQSLSASYDSLNQKVVVIMGRAEGGINRTTARLGTVSGTSISFGGTETVITNKGGTATSQYIGSGKTVVAFNDFSDSEKGKVAVLTVDGSTMSWGTVVTFDEGDVLNLSSCVSPTGEVTLVYEDEDLDNSHFGKFVVVTVSGTTPSVTDPVTFESAYTELPSAAYDINAGKAVVVYQDQGNSSYVTACVLNANVYNLTAENYIGMSQGPVQVFAEGAGSLVEYHSTDTRGNNIAYDAASGKFVAIFNPGPPTSSPPAGYAIVGTVDPSDNSITYGTPVQFESSEVYGDQMGITYDSNAEKVVIAYKNSATNVAYGIVGTVSGTSISFGSPTTFNNNCQFITAAFDSTNNKVVIVYKDNSNLDYGTAIVGTVSGTSISFGTKAVFNSGNTSYANLCFDSTNSKIIIGYRDQAFQQQATCVVGTVSGTSISFGSEVTVSPNSATHTVPIYDPVAEKVVFVYTDSSDSDKGKVKIGTVSGTSISFGSEVTFESNVAEQSAGVFDANAGKVTIVYKSGPSGYPQIISGTVSGSDMTFGNAVQLGSFAAAGYRFGCAYDSSTFRIVSVFIDSDATPDTGESAVFNNFYEIRPSIADGGNALLDTQGGVSENQSSLTAGESYYVLNDGTISTTAGDPSVFAGTAVSSTKLIVKG
jgi:hypothetical protein